MAIYTIHPGCRWRTNHLTVLQWMWFLAVVGELRKVRCTNPQPKYGEEDGRAFIDKINKETEIWANKLALVDWAYESNITDYNQQQQAKEYAEYAKIAKEQWSEVIKYPYESFKDPSLKRQFESYSGLGTAALSDKKRTRLEELIAKMSDIYSTTKLLEWQNPKSSVKPNPKPTISIEPDLITIFTDSTKDSCKLQYYWEGWHGTIGRQIEHLFEEYVQLSNEVAKLDNYTDTSEEWNADFEMDNFDEALHKLYQQILPFYQQLHAYVRRRLAQVHNTKQHQLIEKNGCLPAHILGNLWAQGWQNMYDLTAPYPGKVSVDVTPTMKAKNFTALKMAKMAEEFYTSINLNAMTKTFWEKSIFEKPKDREMVCHASAWDFAIGDDYRIKMCASVNLEYFKIIHHEMGHIQYDMQYRKQPYAFRQGANSGFHEAVGDTIALSVSTAKHLIKVGLLDPKTYVYDKQTEINSLYMMALEKVAFLPFAYVLDMWRWEIFRGKITPGNYNCRYWQMRQNLQGIVPPVDRGSKDFDAGAKYHVIADVPYIKYFVSFIIQFQFHKALCIKAGQYNPKDPASKPLHHCDIYQGKAAGELLGKMLSMGYSKPWQDAMEVLTGQGDMDAGALLEYFKPLHDWLVQENKRAGETVGWKAGHKIKCQKGAVKTTPDSLTPGKKCRYVFPNEKAQNSAKKEK